MGLQRDPGSLPAYFQMLPTNLGFLGPPWSWPVASFLLLLTFFSSVCSQRGPLPRLSHPL